MCNEAEWSLQTFVVDIKTRTLCKYLFINSYLFILGNDKSITLRIRTNNKDILSQELCQEYDSTFPTVRLVTNHPTYHNQKKTYQRTDTLHVKVKLDP
jgi:hypothetical protein